MSWCFPVKAAGNYLLWYQNVTTEQKNIDSSAAAVIIINPSVMISSFQKLTD